MAIQGERGLLQFSCDWLLQLRYNPFYKFLEARMLEWMAGAKVEAGVHVEVELLRCQPRIGPPRMEPYDREVYRCR